MPLPNPPPSMSPAPVAFHALPRYQQALPLAHIQHLQGDFGAQTAQPGPQAGPGQHRPMPHMARQAVRRERRGA